MMAKGFKTPPHSNDNKKKVRALLQESGEPAPIDMPRFGKRAADIITNAIEKARGRRQRRGRR
jgi:hypothetical protein